MTTVPRQAILQAWERVCALDDAQTTAVTKQFLNEQPALSAYLLAFTDEMGTEAGRSIITDLSITIWDAMTASPAGPLKIVRPNDIDDAEEANTRLLQKLELASESDWDE